MVLVYIVYIGYSVYCVSCVAWLVGVFEVVDARQLAHVNGFALAQSDPLSTGLSMAGCGVVEVVVSAVSCYFSQHSLEVSDTRPQSYCLNPL